ELSETEKQTVSALATLASGLAGGLTGDSTAEAVSAAQAGKTTVENNALNPIDFGKGMADISLSQQTLGVDMIKNGASPDELTEALIKNSQGQIPDGQNAAKGLIIAWAEFFGVPVSALTADGEMTPQRATEIVASGVPTSEAKLMQYVVAKAFLAVTKNTTVKAETGSSIIYHENFGGHTIQKHVGKSDAQLLARFENEPNLSASSTFFNQTAADKAIGNGIAANKGQLAEWLAGDQSRLILQHTEKFTVGKVIQKSDGSSYFSKKITIVIDRDPAMPNGYRVHTAYPK
ncbi:RNase A-like domain-containing protein, partial [Entomohabitans teleogrylli]|uniref:RNase A-like domain-containing protein n=1 Tax=Entomohabitans teleogrylli TaxID=1384589 RepID=UPI000ADE20DC